MNTIFRSILCLGFFCIVVPFAEARPKWTQAEAKVWYEEHKWLVGCNFAPSYAINQLEFWQRDTWDYKAVERELKWAGELGFTSLRVYLHDLLWSSEDREGFLERVDWFLGRADENGMGVLFVLLDGVWDPFPKAGKQREPTPHKHNSGWVQSPGVEILKDPQRHDEMKDYIHGFVRRYRSDKRVHGWDLFNEPDNRNSISYGEHEPENKLELATALLKKAYGWARDADPAQPITSAPWLGPWPEDKKLSEMEKFMLEESDIISFHAYGDLDSVRACVESLRRFGRPLLCTEYMARGNGSTFDPILGYFKEQRVGAYNWGFVSGKSQTIYPWDSWEREYTAEPEVWFHDILRRDGSPYRKKEVNYIKRLTGKAPPEPEKARRMAPGGKYAVGDMERPRPSVVAPGSASTPDAPGRPPSDAIVLFDGSDMSQWHLGKKKGGGEWEGPKWKLENGYMEIVPKTGGITSKQKFGSCQIHIEWATPSEVKGSSQGRGNSGVYIVGHGEVQVLDSYQNDTYPDGQAAAIYGRFPPLVNASRKPGEWQAYDIIYLAPELKEGKIVKPATFTVLHNGVLVHHAAEVPGAAIECPISLQDHSNPVRYRNIWVRPLRGYDQPAPDSSPYQGNVHVIPGVIEAEHFDTGAAGKAYLDVDEENQGADYREATQVDIEKRPDASNGHGIGWTRQGEWLRYTVDVQESGSYTIEMPVASNKKGGLFHLEIAGKDITGPISVPDTKSWQKLTLLKHKDVPALQRTPCDQGGNGSRWSVR